MRKDLPKCLLVLSFTVTLCWPGSPFTANDEGFIQWAKSEFSSRQFRQLSSVKITWAGIFITAPLPLRDLAGLGTRANLACCSMSEMCCCLAFFTLRKFGDSSLVEKYRLDCCRWKRSVLAASCVRVPLGHTAGVWWRWVLISAQGRADKADVLCQQQLRR